MAMEHKAFGFRWNSFREALLPRFYLYLEGRVDEVADFARAEAGDLFDPYEGMPLRVEQVNEALVRGEHDFIAEAALTAFYAPSEDVGVGYEYLDVHSRLEALGANYAGLLHGSTLSHAGKLFDPGKMGTFFCDLDEAESKSRLVSTIQDANLRRLLEPMAEAGLAAGGLFITF